MYRAMFNAKEYARQQSSTGIKSVMRAVNLCKDHAELVKTTLAIMPDIHAFTGRVISSRAVDVANLNTARKEMNAFLEDNRRLEDEEANERRLAAAEDEYSWKIMDASFAC